MACCPWRVLSLLMLVAVVACGSPGKKAPVDAADAADPGGSSAEATDTAEPAVPDAAEAIAPDAGEPAVPEAVDVPDTAEPADVGPTPEIHADVPGDPGPTDPLPADLVDVPAGPFWMGCDGVRDTGCEDNGLGGYFDQPYHQVDVPAFAIDRLETTVAAYARCVNAGSCTLPEQEPECTWSAGVESTLPLTCVSWDQANAYCAWRGARLCTEAEWEKAARGGCDTLPAEQQADCAAHQRLNPWGDAPATCDLAVMDPNNGSGGGCSTGWPLAVGSKPAGASPYGALDLVGNVGEWVYDCFEASYDGAPVDGSARTECVWPEGDGLSGQYRSHRGASWTHPVWFQRGAQRGADPPMGTFTNVGIRCCVTP